MASPEDPVVNDQVKSPWKSQCSALGMKSIWPQLKFWSWQATHFWLFCNELIATFAALGSSKLKNTETSISCDSTLNISNHYDLKANEWSRSK